MKIFETVYDKTLQWSKHRFAPFWLSFASFIEAIFFPVPPDVMLIPMSMAEPKKALRFAVYTTLASVLGGIIGYAIGYFAFDWVSGYIQSWGFQTQFDQAQLWFETWGVVVVFLAGFSPIPFKVFTICAGVMNMAFLPFVLSAAVSRFARFFLVARLSAWGGEKYADKIRHYIEMLGWATVALAVAGYAVYSFTH